MKKIINRIARYIVGIWGLTLLFLLACVFQEKNYAADAVLVVDLIVMMTGASKIYDKRKNNRRIAGAAG